MRSNLARDLPSSQANADGETRMRNSHGAAIGKPIATAPQRRTVVLIVEDDDDSRDIMVEALHEHGFAALPARNGREALRTFDTLLDSQPDVIVLDLAMPVMDGHEFLAARAERPEMAFVPVIVISGAAPDRELAASLCNEYLPKPLQLSAFVEAVVRCAKYSAQSRRAVAHR